MRLSYRLCLRRIRMAFCLLLLNDESSDCNRLVHPRLKMCSAAFTETSALLSHVLFARLLCITFNFGSVPRYLSIRIKLQDSCRTYLTRAYVWPAS